MANPQHVEWLLEGVGAWNARREQEDFLPDLREAVLREAVLRGADLREAVLRWAVLTGADLTGADLRWAVLRGADVKSVYSKVGANDAYTFEYTDFSITIDLTQDQIELMDGDTGVLLPEGLHHPTHWPDPEQPEQEPTQHEPHFSPSAPLSDTEALLLSIAAPIDVQWTDEGYLHIDRAELIAVEPEPKRALPAVSASAQMEQLAAVGALAPQIRKSIRANLSPNAAPIVGDICGVFEAIEQ